MSALKGVQLSRDQLALICVPHGARLRSMTFNGQPMVLSYSQDAQWLADIYAVNAICGRVANRIANASFEWRGQHYRLSKNLGDHCLHGGERNFSNQAWHLVDWSATHCQFHIVSEDGDQGFPGRVEAWTDYRLEPDNRLHIHLKAKTNKPTPVDLTHHAYLTLGAGDCRELRLDLNADSVLEKRSDIPTGQHIRLDKLKLDRAHNLGQQIERWRQADWSDRHGFDHFFPICGAEGEPIKAATLLSETVEMTLHTDQPGIFLYTAGHLGGHFAPFSGVCLEAQGYPNAVNEPRFPSPVLMPGEIYQREIILQFSERVHAPTA
ncbi:aldose epimerase family protein [Simiduia agarivorans]|uniref:Galactose-1-epimerase n=1 Tax=Simiduia agarivorans (strain DSM 21679 / JCM 13881 / BCRC 17597 / SA1) TaxID=1117647 RepID=K4KQP2_SIMAS|nr:aldose epimerase family protein [Simiduia agarivorans]AFV00444.1 galactose-1-epimerase [Simiduia agarivorans SA1 = DSM 21679]